MSGYRQVLNKFAVDQLVKPVHIPDYHLMVGSAEYLDGMPLMVYTAAYPSTVGAMVADTAQLTNDQVSEALINNTLEVNDFMGNTALIGSGL